jgi:hypothetical protein
MSKKIKPLSLRLINQLQIVFSAMEFGDYDGSLSACGEVRKLSDQLVLEIEKTIRERHADEVATIKALMPRKGSGTFR